MPNTKNIAMATQATVVRAKTRYVNVSTTRPMGMIHTIRMAPSTRTEMIDPMTPPAALAPVSKPKPNSPRPSLRRSMEANTSSAIREPKAKLNVEVVIVGVGIGRCAQSHWVSSRISRWALRCGFVASSRVEPRALSCASISGCGHPGA